MAKKKKAEIGEAAYGEPLNLPRTVRDGLKKNTKYENEIIAIKHKLRDTLYWMRGVFIGVNVIFLAMLLISLAVYPDLPFIMATASVLASVIALCGSMIMTWTISKRIEAL